MSERTDERTLMLLKTRGPQTAGNLAAPLRITPEAVRQQLARLEDQGLVTYEDVRESVGRPKRVWRLTDRGHARFPDSHAELTLALLESVQAEFGADGLNRLISRREQQTLQAYRDAMASLDTLHERVQRLAEIRSLEGYMAEWQEDGAGNLLLIENHCPICAAATACQGLCRSELELFRAALGPEVDVTRTEHIPLGARRCAYRITPRESSARAGRTR